MEVWRPCDATETATAWVAAAENSENPTSLVLSRQGMGFNTRSAEQIANIKKGGYVLSDCDGDAQVIFIATGSEVDLAVGAQEKLKAEGIHSRVVSMPCTHAYDRQDQAYKDSVLTSGAVSYTHLTLPTNREV